MSSPLRIARIRPAVPATPGEFFFAHNSAPDFGSADGQWWTIIESPFPDSAANTASPSRDSWRAGERVHEREFRFLAPSVPGNVLGMAHNTGAAGRALPPQAFHKSASSVIGPGDPIELPDGVGRVEPEAELTVVIGRKARALTAATAYGAILGYTIGNDVTARDAQAADQLWISGKSPDTFTPAGPWIVTGLDPEGLPLRIVHNGEALAGSTTSGIGWNVAEILVYLTSFMTLQPGDLVLTGFPAEARPLSPGDVVVCRIDGIGELSNPVRTVEWQDYPA